MSNIFKMIELQNKINSILNFNTHYFANIDKSFFSTFETAANIYNVLPDTLLISITEHQRLLSSISNNIDSNTYSYLDKIYNNATYISKYENLDNLTPDNEVIKSINELSDCIKQELNDYTNDDLCSNIESTKVTMQSNKSIDWPAMIAILISLLSVYLQILSTLDSNKTSKQNLEFQSNVIKTLEKINTSLDQTVIDNNIKINASQH